MAGDAAALRSRAYRFLGRILAGDRDAIAAARQLEPFDGWLAGSGETELLAAHHRAFGLEAFPSAGVYTGGDALCSDGDDLASSLERLARREAAAELGALLGWLPPFVAAVRRAGVDPWTQVVDLAVEMIASRARQLGAVPAAVEHEALEVDDGTGLRDLAARLCVPRRAGVLITAGDVAGLARRLELPAGFGPRRQRLARLLESAATYGAGAAALRGLESVVAGHAAELERLELPCDGWRARAAATRATLAAMGDRARDAASG